MFNIVKVCKSPILIMLAASVCLSAQGSGLWTVSPLEYPRMAHAANIQGEVMLGASVGANGIPKQIKQKTGNPLLGEDISRQLLSWRFSPSATDWTTDITIQFVLTEPSATELTPTRVTIESPSRIKVESRLISPDKFVERYTTKNKKR